VGLVIALFFVVVVSVSAYAAGRMHGQLSYRLGYRVGYRQGYLDGDEASWPRRRRDLHATVASVLRTAPASRAEEFVGGARAGTVYDTGSR
jgi:hypothetical protein